jgi:hypothetical protein
MSLVHPALLYFISLPLATIDRNLKGQHCRLLVERIQEWSFRNDVNSLEVILGAVKKTSNENSKTAFTFPFD